MRSFMQNATMKKIRCEVKDSEAENKATLQSFETNYPGVLTEENLDEVLRRASKVTSEKNEDEIEFFSLLSDFILQRKQKKVIEQGRF